MTTRKLHAPGIGQSLRDARQAAGLSQEALAERLGCKQSVVSAWEREKRGLTL